jgi:hypothetical protein
MKKNLWIAVLLVAAFALAAMTGCVNALKEEVDTETYEEYVLDKGFNAWAGQVYQSGWAIGGIVFQGKGDALTVAKDLGYDLEMFQKARYLEIEMPDETYPRSGVDIIWGGEDATGSATGGGGMWNQQPIAGGSGDVDTTFAKKDGNKLRIDLTKALKNYSTYKAATTTKVKIVMQVNAPSYGNVEGLVKKATLLIPNTPPPYVSIKSLTLPGNKLRWTGELELVAKILPDNATNQTVNWAIVGWWADGKDPDIDAADFKLPNLDLSIPGSLDAYEAAKKDLFEKVNWKQEVYVTDNTVFPNTTAFRSVPGIIVAPGKDASVGKFKVRATVKQGEEVGGKTIDVVKNLTVSIVDPEKLFYKLSPTDTTTNTIYWNAVDNGNVSGGTMELFKKSGDLEHTGYTIKFAPGGQYGNSMHYVEVNFTGDDSLSKFKGLKCHYEGKSGDGKKLNGKSVRLKAMVTKPPRTYNPGPFISTVSFPNDYKGFEYVEGGATKYKEYEATLDFEFFKDNSTADGKSGIFSGGVGADLSNATLFGSEGKENAGRFITKDEEDNDINLKTAKKIYFWILPWAEGNTEFTITDIEFYK